MFAVADADNQRASFSCGKKPVGLLCADYNQAVSALNPVKRQCYCLLGGKIALNIEMLDKVCQHFRIGLTAELDPLSL